jgi:hypothetical protein
MSLMMPVSLLGRKTRHGEASRNAQLLSMRQLFFLPLVSIDKVSVNQNKSFLEKSTPARNKTQIIIRFLGLFDQK